MDASRYETCSILDPAIDVGRSRFDKFFMTRDIEHLVFTDGKLPTIFEMRRPPERLVRTFIRMGDIESLDLCVRAFKASFLRAKNFTSVTGDYYEVFEAQHVKTQSGLFEVLSEDECDQFPTQTLLDVGGVAYQRCHLNPTKKPLFRAAHTSQLALDLAILQRLPADEILSSLDQSNDACRARLADLLAKVGAVATDVTAKAKSDSPETVQQTCADSSQTSAA